MSEELATRQEDTCDFLIDDNDDMTMQPVIALPDYAGYTDQKVLKSVRDVFKNFDAANPVFSDTDAIVQYMNSTIQDIRDMRYYSKSSQLLHNAAALARFWYLGATIDKALATGKYGTSAISKIAASLEKRESYVYQIRAVATRLSVVDCYLLGIRGLTSTHLRRLAQIKDDTTRQSVISAFIAAIKDTSDVHGIAEAKKRLTAAINAQQNLDIIDVSTSDPNNGGSEINVSDEYQGAIDALATLSKTFKKLGGEKFATDICSKLENFYITSETPDAELNLKAVKEEAVRIRKLMKDAEANMGDIIVQLDSLKGVSVTDADADSR